jgi:hypothetical protein
MPEHVPPIDDRQLLKLIETGLGESEAAKQLSVSTQDVQQKVKAYLDWGILQPNGEREKVDWKAYGHWAREQKSFEAV